MQHDNIEYRGYTIKIRVDVKSHSALIFKSNNLVKCIAGNISASGETDVIQKSKDFIDKF